MIFSTINAKDLIMQEKESYLYRHWNWIPFLAWQKKFRLLLNTCVDDFHSFCNTDNCQHKRLIWINFHNWNHINYVFESMLSWTPIHMSNKDTLFIISTLSQNDILDILYWLKNCFRFIKINSTVTRHHRGNHTENSRRRRSHISISGNKVANIEDLVTPRNSTLRGNVFIVMKMLIRD